MRSFPRNFRSTGNWFARDIGDGQVVRTLLTEAATRSAVGVLRSRRYKVVVKTSDIRGAGTDANVYLTMFGEGPDGKTTKSAEIKLENSSNNFERAMVRDEATTTWVDVMMRRLGLRKLAWIVCSSSNNSRDLAVGSAHSAD